MQLNCKPQSFSGTEHQFPLWECHTTFDLGQYVYILYYKPLPLVLPKYLPQHHIKCYFTVLT
jgi:hypothetical protein